MNLEEVVHLKSCLVPIVYYSPSPLAIGKPRTQNGLLFSINLDLFVVELLSIELPREL